MDEDRYDVIVVGARCAGSPTAMLLARHGHRVLLVDRSTFPSDTVSTHLVHPLGVAALQRWGLLDRVVATGCPPIDTYAFDFGPFTISGSPGTPDSPVAYSPRRTVLDQILVEAAAESGAEIREGFTVDELVIEDGSVVGVRGHGKDDRRTVTERARVVVGADGLRSFVARVVRPEQYREQRPLLCGYYTYWSGLPVGSRWEIYVRPHRGIGAWQTNEDLTLVIAGWPYAEFEANRKDFEGTYLRTLELVPQLAERLRPATRTARLVGAAVPNFFRKPYGPGWALVGDAGYTKDPITAQGIQDAFRDAELCAAALHDVLAGVRPFDAAMSEYRSRRDEQVLAMYEFTLGLAALEPPPPDLQRLLAAAHGDQEAMDQFARVNAGTESPADFFAPANVERILAAAGQPLASG
ncbi:NAD(P)/FAD-dependent oxidoreductase [Geodermatophilus sp. URMC 61]|uniref:NAD(P)/FAD-dependent oxidoreductase n=1 Tax=Geodermatophilus sp. URMC 61 TaxID=3423411 RepID=UPI00406CC780